MICTLPLFHQLIVHLFDFFTIDSDYRAMPALDRYEAENLDDDDYDAMSIDDRLAAEEELRRRDRETLGRRVEDALIYGNLPVNSDFYSSNISRLVTICLIA